MNIQLSLIKKWFDMTKSGIKTEDYREITPYWCNRLLLHKGEVRSKDFWNRCYIKHYKHDTLKKFFECEVIHQITQKPFKNNIMTLGYPKSTDADRILKLEHKGIEIRTGNPKWGAEPNKLYFVIKHGEFLLS